MEGTLNSNSVQAPAMGSNTSHKMQNSPSLTRQHLNEPFLGNQITSCCKTIPNPFSTNQFFRWITVTKFQHSTHSLAYATIRLPWPPNTPHFTEATVSNGAEIQIYLDKTKPFQTGTPDQISCIRNKKASQTLECTGEGHLVS